MDRARGRRDPPEAPGRGSSDRGFGKPRLDGRDEPIASLREGLDIAGSARGVVENGADLPDAGVQADIVVDMSLVDPPADNITELSLSFFNASVLSMGRFGTDKRGDWLFAIRRSNLDLIIDALDPDLGTPRFGDMIMRVGWSLVHALT